MQNSFKKLSIVIPVYNEEDNLKKILKKVESFDAKMQKEIILVNDASKDSSYKIMQSFSKNKEYKILNNKKNLGKSQTVKKGILASTGDLVVIQDADLEYDPEELMLFINKFLEQDVDVVYGNRFGKKNKIIYLQNWIGNTFLSFVSMFFTGFRANMWPRDMEVCYKMAKGNIFRDIASTITSTSNFGVEPEITAKFSKYKVDGEHIKFAQIPINYYPRSIEEGKKMHAFKDGIKALVEILKFNIL